jgi:uncharacterized membrane protein (GlpM family)
MPLDKLKQIAGALIYTFSCYYMITENRLQEKIFLNTLVMIYTILSWCLIIRDFSQEPLNLISQNKKKDK